MNPLSVIRDEVRAIAAYPAPSATGMIKLDSMENPYRLPEPLARALGEHLAQVAINRYPSANPVEFKRKLADSIGLPAGQALMLGNGSDELIHLVIQACAKPGAVVMAPWPSFVIYEMSARFNGCRFVGVPVQADFSLDRAAMLAAIEEHQPAVIFLAWPNNPTGNLFDRADVEAVLAAAPGLVISDEAYLPFAQDTWLPQLGSNPRLMVLRTLSKLGLAGIRLGYLCASTALIAELDKVRPPYNINVLTLAAADFMLDHLAVLEAQAAMIRAEREWLAPALAALPGVTVFSSAGNFLLFRVADPDLVFAQLKARAILIKNVSHAHPLLAGCLRTTVGAPAENAAFLSALTEILSVTTP
ncbi:MAG: histidinol-phosphate transaminase [Burkholderiaceae bacterium]